MKKQVLYFGMLLASLGLLHGGLALPAEAAAPAIHYQAAPKAVAEERTLIVYPNPSSGIIHLTINGFEGRRAEVSVLNVIGTVMYRETLSELNDHSTKTLDLREFASGLYYVKLEAGNSSKLCKLIIH